MINRDRNATITGQVALNGFVPRAPATMRSYGKIQDEAARTNGPAASQDLSTNTLMGVASAFTNSFAPYSLTLFTLSLAAPPALALKQISPTSVNLEFNSDLGPSYFVEVRTNLAAGSWMVLTNYSGNGSTLTFKDPQTENPARFYRLRLQ